jgi:uncharacterized coiled-coil protein SlyX
MKTNTLSLILISLITCFASLRPAEAVDPPSGGDYPGGNTAEDLNAPFSPASGVHNTAVGDGALENNQGDNNTAAGYAALRRNISGNQNTATGALALNNNDLGRENTANGFQALLINTRGSRNTATGERALERNSTGNNNTATGVSALFRNTGDNNTAVGFQALQNNTTGDNNTAIGFGALNSSTTGRNNTAIGLRAGLSSTTGENNIYIGENMFGVPGESNHTYVRNLNITSVSGGGADTVTVDLGTGLIGHLSSSRRYKQNIKPMDTTSEALYRLRPVTYRYKKDIDRTQSPAFGLVAEEVAQVNPALVAHDANGQPESVHYEMVNAMLLNEFLKQHRKITEQEASITHLKSTVAKQEATIAQQQKGMDAVTARLNEQAAQIQKVSAQLEASKPAPQMVNNP